MNNSALQTFNLFNSFFNNSQDKIKVSFQEILLFWFEGKYISNFLFSVYNLAKNKCE